jgi:cellulose biosynthesis protein BcsQ
MLTDAHVQELSADKDYLEEVKPEDLRRRDKKVRDEYDPGKLEVTRKIRSRMTERLYKEILDKYEMALLDCRKALFIDPVNALAMQTQRNIERKMAEFKAKYETQEEPADAGSSS